MRLRFSHAAQADLSHAYDYIAADCPSAARTLLPSVDRATRLLVDMPNMAKAGRMAGTREMLIGRTPYIAVYKITDEEIVIVRIVHGHQVWPPK